MCGVRAARTGAFLGEPAGWALGDGGEVFVKKLCRPTCWRRHRLWHIELSVARLFFHFIKLRTDVHVTVVTGLPESLNRSQDGNSPCPWGVFRLFQGFDTPTYLARLFYTAAWDDYAKCPEALSLLLSWRFDGVGTEGA